MKRFTKQEKVSSDHDDGDSQDEYVSEREKKQQDFKTVKITLEAYQNIVNFFPTADIRTQCTFDGRIVGETTWIPVTGDSYLPIDKTFSFTFDKTSPKDIDKLISLPVLMTISQSTGSFHPFSYDYLQINTDSRYATNTRHLESIVEIYEEFTGQTIPRSDLSEQRPKKTKRTTKTKSSKRDRSTQGSDSYSKETVPRHLSSNPIVPELPSEYLEDPVIYGMCTIDFLPLFQGKTTFSETLLIRPIKKYDDEKMVSFKAHPKIIVTVSTDVNLSSLGVAIMNITVEAIYNIPSLMKPETDYRVNVLLPKATTKKIPISFTNSRYTFNTRGCTNRCWPNMQQIGLNANTTKYVSSTSKDELLNKVGVDIVSYLNEDGPTLVFNTMRRSLITESGWEELIEHVNSHRKIVLEFLINQKGTRKSNFNIPRPDKEASIPSLKYANEFGKKLRPPSLHFMSILDVSSLLYPGVSKVRIAAPVCSYNSEEVSKYSGQDDTSPNIIIKKSSPSREAVNRSKDKPNKLKEKDSEKSEKSSVKNKEKDPKEKDLKMFLPLKPEAEPKPDPIVPILNEQEKPCFILVEIELSKCIEPSRNLEDLRDSTHELIRTKPQFPTKLVLCKCLIESYYKELLDEMMKDIEKKFQRFLTEHPDRKFSSNKTSDFIDFLQTIGTYQTYSSSMMKVATLLSTSEFKPGGFENTSRGYQTIPDLFVYLISEMNDSLNKLTCHEKENKCEENMLERIIFYAKEAVEMRNTDLADRYFLERICRNKQNSDYWFEYGVFFLELKKTDRAFECMKKALTTNSNHGNSLIALGVLLDNKGQKEEAEMYFLNLMILLPKWVEGWGVLYIFYTKHDCYEGMDVALEMANKYLNENAAAKLPEDLAWTSNICPNTIFLRTAIVLLKMRLYDWAEIALAEELTTHFGLVHYLLSAICYYKGLYSHALEHLEEAKKNYGSNYAVASLSGHCFFALNREEEAKNEYYHAIAEFDGPKDNHLVHLNLTLIFERAGDDQKAKKFALLACQYNPTPYTWLKAGLFYLRENDLLSAEECFSEGNVRDPSHSELWGNLCLVNFKLRRLHEAEICYNQAIRNGLKNSELLENIEKERNSD
ncbi:cilia- and flagella-associated protein 70 [Leptinotarsa decemlineata]|uniref:cilia- and flagella-associated protein 70 n=1 Tax=Leptinotarsa decemlineata TaxID=7539 RepID=UPI003D304723